MTQRDDRMRHAMLDQACHELPDVIRTAWGVVNAAIPLPPAEDNTPKSNDRTVIRKAAFDKVLTRLLEDLDTRRA